MPPCRDCGQEWTFTVLEQALFVEKGYRHEPSRCKACREKRAARLEREGREPREGRDGRNGRQEQGRKTHSATCSQCGGTAQLPFVPRKDRPVYCSNCYNQQRMIG
ncbi:MAG: zinc-ribbon domain containing protein [Armatimonadetes bacterium]|nr:zinc-ribbon domain containing protein [Armatimonadota bacterium]